jgi:hypothetical protein
VNDESRLDAAATAYADWLPRIDFVVDHPPAVVWPFILRTELWITTHRFEYLSGEPGAVGAIRRLTTSTGTSLTETVNVVPERRIVHRLLPLERPLGATTAMSGYLIYNLHDLGGRTLVSYETVARAESSLVGQDELSASFEQAYTSGLEAWTATYVPNLKRLLAAAAAEASAR